MLEPTAFSQVMDPEELAVWIGPTKFVPLMATLAITSPPVLFVMASALVSRMFSEPTAPLAMVCVCTEPDTV